MNASRSSRVSDDQNHEEDTLEDREHPAGPEPKFARQQERQEHRGEDRAGHVPARFRDDRTRLHRFRAMIRRVAV
jgi:hypothetical protein